MPLHVSVASTAAQKMKTLAGRSPLGYVEFRTTVFNASQTSLRGSSPIAVLNHQYDVHWLEPPDPGPDVLVLADSSEMVVIDLKNPKGAPHGAQQKRHYATEAAAAKGIAVTDIHVVP